METQEGQVRAKVRLLEEAPLAGVEPGGKRAQDDKYHEQLDQRHGRRQLQKEEADLPRERASSPAPQSQPQ